jgi:hypothetical protein
MREDRGNERETLNKEMIDSMAGTPEEIKKLEELMGNLIVSTLASTMMESIFGIKGDNK